MALAQLLSVRSVAQLCPVVSMPGFLTEADIAAVLSLGDRHTEAHGPPPLTRRGWKTQYLNADGLFKLYEPVLYDRLKELSGRIDTSCFPVEEASNHSQRVDARPNAGISSLVDSASPSSSLPSSNLPSPAKSREEALAASLHVRCIELHEGREHGSLADLKHFDLGSVVTVDVMLEDGFCGGAFQTLEVGGVVRSHEFRAGDALVFPSLKYHSITPITTGVRKVLVMEFWDGQEKACNHRCEVPWEACAGNWRGMSVHNGEE